MGNPINLDYVGSSNEPAKETWPWRGMLAIACLILTVWGGYIPLSGDETDLGAYLLPNVLIPVAGMLGWRCLWSGRRMDLFLGLPAMVASVLLIAFIIHDRLAYLTK